MVNTSTSQYVRVRQLARIGTSPKVLLDGIAQSLNVMQLDMMTFMHASNLSTLLGF